MMCAMRVFLLVLVTASLALAQGRGGQPRGQEEAGPDGAGGFGRGDGRPYQENRLDRIADMLKLNKEQKSAAKEIFDSAQKEAAPLREEIQKSRSAIGVAMLSQKGQPEIDQLLTNHGTLMAKMAGIELGAFTKLVSSLNADQQKRVGQLFGMMSGMFSGRNWNTIGN
jgi:hypothetical protein